MWRISGAAADHVYRCRPCRRRNLEGESVKACPCGRRYRASSRRQVTCSRECLERFRAEGLASPTRTCPRCGDPLIIGRSVCACAKPRVRACGDCGVPAPKYRLYCQEWGDRCESEYRSTARARRRGAVISGDRITVDGIGDRDHWLCHLCFSGVNPTLPAGHFGSKTLDHLLPVSEGGAHAIENVYLA